MGIGLWLLSAIFAFLVARIIPSLRQPRRGAELLAALLAAFAGGVIATAFDFGGWNSLDWRAAFFCFFLALTATGLIRLRRNLQPGSRS